MRKKKRNEKKMMKMKIFSKIYLLFEGALYASSTKRRERQE